MLPRGGKESFRDEPTPTLAVFSHPNHELAAFGLLQRLRPNIIFLTDGGGRKRLSETQRGLKSIDLLNDATFLNYTEKAFYDSLLTRDHTFYEEVTDRVFGLLDSLRPTRILCDAVEFYNPVHDLSLPIVQAALRSSDKASVFEVPIVYQKSMKREEYELQRFPASRRERQIEIQLTEGELDKKLKARDYIYTSLLDQIGTLLSELPAVHAGLEVVTPASFSLQEPGPDRILRYEWRAELLQNRGEIDSAITYSEHYVPVASALLYPSGLTSKSRSL